MEVDNTLKRIITPYKPQNSPKFRVCGVEVVNLPLPDKRAAEGIILADTKRAISYTEGKQEAKQ